MLKALLHCMLISTAVLAADNSDPFSSPTVSSAKSERVILSEESGEPSAKKQRVDTPYETLYIFLPDELITHIATFARIKDGIQMSSVCKNWKQVLDQSDIWQHYASRLAGYEFFKDAPCFKQEDDSIDYKRIIKAATYPFIFIFEFYFGVGALQRNVSSLLGQILTEKVDDIFSPVVDGEEVRSSDMPYTFHSASPYYSPSNTQTVIKNYQEEYPESIMVCFHYDIHQGILEILETPDGEGTTCLRFSSKNRKWILGTDTYWKDFIYIWSGQEGRRVYQSIKGYAIKVLGEGELILGQHKNQAHVWSEKPYYVLESLNNGEKSKAHDISRDQALIVGKAQDGSANNQWRAVKWTNRSIQSLGTLNGGRSSKAIAISTHGDIIIGNAKDGHANNIDRAVKWTNGMIQPLDILKEGDFSKAYGMSADGQVIVGESCPENVKETRISLHSLEEDKAVRWTSKGIENLTSLLKNILPPASKLNRAFSIDSSGSLIQGNMHRREQFLEDVAYEVPSERYPPEMIKSNDIHQRNADGSFMLGIPYSWETYFRETYEEKGLGFLNYINSKGERITEYNEPTPRNRAIIIILKEVPKEVDRELRYLAFVPREDILEKEGLRAHF